MATWLEDNDTHTAKVGAYTLKVVQGEQFGSYGFVVVRGHIVKAGDMPTLEEAKTAAEAAANNVAGKA